MGKPYKQPQKREVMAGSKLEIEMLQYSLNEANQKLAKKTADLNRNTYYGTDYKSGRSAKREGRQPYKINDDLNEACYLLESGGDH